MVPPVSVEATEVSGPVSLNVTLYFSLSPPDTKLSVGTLPSKGSFFVSGPGTLPAILSLLDATNL